MRSFLIRFLIITCGILTASYLVLSWLFPDIPVFFDLLPVLVIAIVTFLSHLSLAGLISRDPKRFIRRFLVVTTLRILGYIIFVLFVAYLYKAWAKPFIIHFLVTYLLYLVFEVYELSSKK